METADVVIVGAGPAGAFLGYLLAKQGIDCLIIEKQRLPRYKPCGGGLTSRTLALLPFPVDEVAEDRSHTFHLGIDGRALARKRLSAPFLAMVSRDRFDHLLVQKAKAAGAEVRDGVAFRSLSGEAGNLQVETSKGEIAARILVGADGVSGRTARALGLRVQARKMWALEAELYGIGRDIAGSRRGEAHFDFLPAIGGYGWLFPKSDHLSIGVLTVSGDPRALKSSLNAYIKSKGLTDDTEIRTCRGQFIPFSPSPGSRFGTQRGILVGDAAGFTDPITGEGIYFALKGATIAADAVAAALAGEKEALETYGRILRKRMMPETRCAGWIASLFYPRPRACEFLLNRCRGEFAEFMLRIIEGEKSYLWLMATLLHPRRTGWIVRAFR